MLRFKSCWLLNQLLYFGVLQLRLCFNRNVDSAYVFEDSRIEYSAIGVVDSDWYRPFPKIVNLVSTVASVGRSSEASSVEREKGDEVVDVAVAQPSDGQTGAQIWFCHRSLLSNEGWPDFISFLTSVRARLCYPSKIPGCEIPNPTSGIDMESGSGVATDASCIKVEELWLKAKPTAVPAPSCSPRLGDDLGGYWEYHYSDCSDVEN